MRRSAVAIVTAIWLSLLRVASEPSLSRMLSSRPTAVA